MGAVFEVMRLVRGYLNSRKPERVLARLLVQDRPLFRVPSETHPGVEYSVTPDDDGQWICTPCGDFRARRKPCKHVIEVLFRYYPDTITAPTPDQMASVISSAKDWYAGARRFKRVPYSYEEGPAESTRLDQAATDEPNRIKSMLAEVGWVLDKRHPHYGVGRPPLSPGDKVVAIVLREYRRTSIRRFQAEADALKSSGIIRIAPCKTTIVTANSEIETTQQLMEAFELVTEPFRLMEQHIISDATAFSPLFVSNWLDSDYGNDNYRPGTIWFKQHTTVGRISKAILAFCITPAFGSATGDTSNFAPMLLDLRRRDFALIDLAIADNTYLNAANIALTKALGIRLVGPLKPKNYGRDGLPSAAIRAIAEFRQANPEAYDEHTRARQAIEGVFWTEKRPTGHLSAVGSQHERDAYSALLVRAAATERGPEQKAILDDAMQASLFRSRLNECISRVIVQVLKRTIALEKLYNRRISYAVGSKFSRHREYSPIERDDNAAA